MPVRRVTLEIYVQNFPDQTQSILSKFLLDNNISIRDFCQFYLKREGVDLVAYYRNFLDRPSDQRLICNAISGLGEVGTRENIKTILAYSNNPIIKIEKSIIYALAKLDREQYIEYFLGKLVGEKPGVSKLARNALIPVVHFIDSLKLWESFQTLSSGFVKKNILVLLSHGERWDKISYMLEAVSKEDEIISKLAKKGIAQWVLESRKNYTSPTSMQLTKLKQVLDRNNRFIEKNDRDEIRFVINQWN